MTQIKKKGGRRWFDLLLVLTVALSAFLALRGGAFQTAEVSSGRFTVSASPTATPDPLAAFAKQREEARERETRALETLTSGDTANDSLRASAQEALLALTRCAERELAVEAALAGMGVNGVAYVTDDLAYVYVREKLTESQAALLFLNISEITGLDDRNIRVSDANSTV